ncbi:PIN domain-containing protein [Streptomyces sp. NPDC050423]|uniref:PIN domain-containing protein n=1 Tax=Streptomyces sp. NPDC050423 TaxID=3155402 RepID=UPI003419B32E
MLKLAEAGLYEPLRSADILEELRRNVAEKVSAGRAKGLVEAMAGAFPDSLVTDYAKLVSAMTNDPKDRHVPAAAVRAQAHAVVTLNVRDFPAGTAEPYEIEVLGPDDFLLDLLDLTPVDVFAVLRTRAQSYRREPRDVHGLLDRLAAGGTPQFAAEFRRRL